MPELPELEVVRDVLQRRVLGTTITGVDMLAGSAIVVRDLTNGGFVHTCTGAQFASVARRGKFVVFTLNTLKGPVFFVLNPKLTGRLQLATRTERRFAKTHVVFALSSGEELRYVDQKRMGQLYLAHELESVPDFAGMGPEPFDLSPEE